MTAEERSEHKRLLRAAWRARRKADGEGGRRQPPSHLCADPGPAIAEPDWKPRAVKANPEEIMRAAFQGRTYAPVPPAGAD
jgi:hypothetical protein